MAALCGKCEGEILNSDFIKCYGSCGYHYHAKCVSLNKTTLNAVTSCANIYWYCHSCNDKKIDPNDSTTNIKEDMNLMMKSLSECLLNGFAMMTEKIVDNISSRMPSQNVQNVNNVNHSAESSNKRRRNDADDDNVSQLATRKKFIFGTNDKNSVLAVANVSPQTSRLVGSSSQSREPRKSIVISNISKNITENHIIDYLADELKIDKENIRVTPLAPAGKNLNDLTYMQYRVSTQASMYPRTISADTWPKGVRVRDFVLTKRNVTATLDNFLVKKASQTPPENAITPPEPISQTTETIQPQTESTVLDTSTMSTNA